MTAPPWKPSVAKRSNSLFREEGIELSGPKEAFETLRTAARDAIADGGRLGIPMQSRRVRLSDEAGVVLFDGTLEEAAKLQIDGRVILPTSG